jgi:hypothetical protein
MEVGTEMRFHSDVKNLTSVSSTVKKFFPRATQDGPILHFDVMRLIFGRESDTN